MAAEWIGADHLLGFGCQAIEPVAQIDRTAGKINFGSRRQIDHVCPFSARSTRARAFSLTDASTLRRVPFGSVISTLPVLPFVDGDDCEASGSGSDSRGVHIGGLRVIGPSMMPAGTNVTFSAAPIATAAALRADRQL
jgi:hypothetical protein